MDDFKVECCKRKCKHIHLHSERVAVRDPDYKIVAVNQLVCPKCGHEDFYYAKDKA